MQALVVVTVTVKHTKCKKKPKIIFFAIGYYLRDKQLAYWWIQNQVTDTSITLNMTEK